MHARTPIIAGTCLLVAAYVAYPFVTLYRLDSALSQGDASTFARLVDWPSVREGLQEDIADEATDVTDPRAITTGVQLAPFGYSFARGVAGRALQQDITPQRVIAGLQSAGGGAGGMGLRLAYFDGWSQVVVRLGTGPGRSDIRLRLNLDRGVWRVTRIWLPRQMLREANTPPDVQTVAARLPPG